MVRGPQWPATVGKLLLPTVGDSLLLVKKVRKHPLLVVYLKILEAANHHVSLRIEQTDCSSITINIDVPNQ